MRTEYLPPAAAFTYWTSGDEQHEVHADPPLPQEAKPFHVFGYVPGAGSIACNLLVFARDAEHAVQRVVTSVRECLDKEAASGHISDYTETRQKRANWVLTASLVAEPFDTSKIAAEVIWASNGGLL